jgi:PiT family inorganic phosphate transporter
VTVVLFLVLLVGGLVYAAFSLTSDVTESGARTTTYLPFILRWLFRQLL